DYEQQVRFFVPKGIAYKEGKAKHFQKAAAFLQDAIIASDGGSLVLCSSHEQVEQLYELLYPALTQKNILLLKQARGKSASSVLSEFRQDLNSVLIGTLTLWQGVDVPGDSLRSLFIFKIPYKRPSAPVIRARMDFIDAHGGNGFEGYYEPLAALELKQGFGRLIRKKTDVGIAVLLDEGLLGRPRIVASLPEGVTVQRASPDQVIQALAALAANVQERMGTLEVAE
ncbi:MAG: helicase C-terminal domain-containing protein, partial [bacterium]|nr:helicase C-terminal domain-containing protein [bacterium]